MPTNNYKEKKINKEGVIYALILVAYFSTIFLVFIFSVKFLSNTINSTLSVPQESQINIENQIDLKSYALIENKLNLNQVATTTISTSTNSILLATTTTSTISTITIIEAPEVVPKIVISNSTLRAGLAGILKEKLQAAGLVVLRTNNTKPTEKQTIIKIKSSLNSDSNYITKIKKIVSADYDFIVKILTEEADHNIEIIIGSK
jgi:intein/homing endonuclease